MLVLGIDPGTATSGYGIVSIEHPRVYSVKHGLIETKKSLSPERRLHAINVQLSSIINTYNPEVLAIEKVFFATNAKTAIRVGQAQGVILYTAAVHKIPVVEYAPGTIKKVISGNGRADKQIMQEAVRSILGRHITHKKGKKTHFDNEADALAVALCHIISCNDIKTDGIKSLHVSTL